MHIQNRTSRFVCFAFLGVFVSLVTAIGAQTAGNGIGGGSPDCKHKLDIPPHSQSNVQSGCTSWTECEESWQCPTSTPGTVSTCGTLVSFPRKCRDCTGGYWDSSLQRCVVGVSGQCGHFVDSGTRTIYLNPAFCN